MEAPAPVLRDVTVPLRRGLLVWPEDPPFESSRLLSLAHGDDCNLTRLSCCAHSGTHVDAPCHYLPDGGGVESLALDRLLGPAWLADAGEAPALNAATLEVLAVPPECRRLLVRTRNSRLWDSPQPQFDRDYVGVTRDGAAWLTAHGVALIGVDALSVAPWDDLEEPHRLLLGAGVVVLETLDLRGVEPGWWTLLCLPLSLPGSDGAPARVVLARGWSRTEASGS